MRGENAASLVLAGLGTVCAAVANKNYPAIQIRVQSEPTTRLANVHVSASREVRGRVSFTHGPCTVQVEPDSHHVVSSVEQGLGAGQSRLLWTIPEDAPDEGCISAWDERGALVGRSEPQNFGRAVVKRATKPIAMTKANGFDPLGQWFDGVKSLKQKQPSPANVQAAKKKNIGIVGAGLSGLTTYLLLHQAGFTNVHVLEASNRLGGRVHTHYLRGGPRDYSYQELGAMRLPIDYVDPDTKKRYNVSDTQLVFELINEINRINGAGSPLRVELIEWIDTNDNGLQYFNGRRTDTGLPPTLNQIAEDPSLSPDPDYDDKTMATYNKLQAILPGNPFIVQMAKSMYKAHRQWTDKGLDGEPGDRWSEFAFISQYLNGSLNSTDVIDSLQDPQSSFWEFLYDSFYDSADSWATIDGGMSRLPMAFGPLLGDKVRFNTKVERASYADGKVTLQYKKSFRDAAFQNSTHDYVVVSPPFTVVRQWRLPDLGTTMKNAIQNLIYDGNCKVGLEYSHRFWQTLKNPIFGGCSTASDIPGVGMVCYPSYNLNATDRPATIMASYIDASFAHEISRMQTMSDEEHVQYILDAMCEIHGEETRKLYTGKSVRKCWNLDPYTSGAFANPSTGQHELYLPLYLQVHKNMIFIGEHTSYTHGWISSAIDSGIRGAVQMMLELGLVDEAKAAVKKWMVPWINI